MHEDAHHKLACWRAPSACKFYIDLSIIKVWRSKSINSCTLEGSNYLLTTVHVVQFYVLAILDLVHVRARTVILVQLYMCGHSTAVVVVQEAY